MSAQHTPGPWWVSGIDSDEVHCRIFSKDMGCNVHVKLVDAPSVGSLIPDEQLKANARLIAAAPDLLMFAAGLSPLAIEMKTDKGKPSAEQLTMQDALHQRGVTARICHGADEAYQAMMEWLQSKEGKSE